MEAATTPRRAANDSLATIEEATLASVRDIYNASPSACLLRTD